MYAVIQTGGKQYRMQPGDIIQVEKLEGELGSSLKFDQVLMLSRGNEEKADIILGKPFVNGALVNAEVVGQGRGDKILIIKMKRRKQYRRTQGHRQNYTQLLITNIQSGSGETFNLSEADKANKLSQFHSQLKEKGLAHTPKTLGSRVRMAKEKAAEAKDKNHSA